MLRTVALAFLIWTLAVHTPFDTQNGNTTPVLNPGGQPGAREIKALAAAWPDRISETAFRDGEWMLRIDSTWFAWANGRLLPESRRDHWKEYAALGFYSYPRSLPRLPNLDGQTAARLRASVDKGRTRPPRRSEEFLGALLRAPTRAATEARLFTTEIAGFSVNIHERLREPVASLSKEIERLRLFDPAVAAFLGQLAEMNGYNYRFVEGTRSRSLHSYGTAIDLIPKSYGGRHTYWQWAMSDVEDWWTIPYEKRWMPPLALVAAFERQGFVWGGKWLLFDTMHFEYRPEILRLRLPGDLLDDLDVGDESRPL